MSKAYMANNVNNTVTVIDTYNDSIIVSGISVGTDPLGVAITPDGTQAFIVNANSSNPAGSISVLSTVGNVVTTTISLSGYGKFPAGIAIGNTPNGVYAYVSIYEAQAVVVVDTVSHTVVKSIAYPAGVAGPLGVAITPNGDYVYVANEGGGGTSFPGTVTIIETTSNTYVTSFTLDTVDTQPIGVAITPDGSTVYVTRGGGGDNKVAYFAATGSAPSGTIPTITVGTNPNGIAITPNGNTVYVTNSNDGTVSYFATGASPTVHTITGLGSDPVGIAITPDGSKVYVGNANAPSGATEVISTVTNTVTTSIGGGGNSFGIFIQDTLSSGFGANFISQWFGC